MKAGVRKVVKYKLNIYSKEAVGERGRKNEGGRERDGWREEGREGGMEEADAVRLTDRPFPAATNSSGGG